MLGVVFAGGVVIRVAVFALFVYRATQADLFPAFMADYQAKRSGSYPEAASTFPEFLGEAFPTGSDAKDAIAQMTKGGFEVKTSSSDSVQLFWIRHAGPWREPYWILVDQSADGRIAKITGAREPICF